MAEILAVLGAFFGNARAINIASLLAGALAGLYGYQFLGKRDGLLRQIIVAVPSSCLIGGYFYSLDQQSHLVYSAMPRTLFNLPASGMSSWLFPLAGAIFGFVIPLVNPNIFRLREHRLTQVRRVAVVLIHMGAAFFLWLVCLSVNFAKLSWLEGLGWSSLDIVIASALLALLDGAAIMSGPFLLSTGSKVGEWVAGRGSKATHLDRLLRGFVGFVAFVVEAGVPIAIGWFVFAYAIDVMGWSFWLLSAAFGTAFLCLGGLQYAADRLGSPRKTSSSESTQVVTQYSEQSSAAFLYISFGFFLVALVLQAYQVIALSN